MPASLIALLIAGCVHNGHNYKVKLYSNGTVVKEWKSADGIIYHSENKTCYFYTTDNKLIKITAGELEVEEDKSTSNKPD